MVKDWITAHVKGIVAAVGAVLILVIDQSQVDIVVGILTSIGVLLFPNNQAASQRIYG